VPVGREFRANTTTEVSNRRPAVARSADGDIVVVWDASHGIGARDVFGQRFDASGNRLGGEFRVNSYTTDGQHYASVAATEDGRFIVVWSSDEQDGSAFGIFGQRYDSDGHRVGAEFQINTTTTRGQRRPDVSTDDVGNFVVVWESLRGTTVISDGIFGQRYDPDGIPLGGEFRVSTGAYDEHSPATASSSDGSFVVVWDSVDQDGEDFGVFARRYDASGLPLGGEFQVNTYTTRDQRGADVAETSDGEFVIVWSSLRQTRLWDVFGQRYDASGSRVGGEFRINSYSTSNQAIARVSSDAAGRFVVVWVSRDQDGSHYGMFGQAFEASGAPLGGEFQANTHTELEQTFGAVASSSGGDFVVAWMSYAHVDPPPGLNTDHDIYARLFAGPGLQLSVVGACPGLPSATVVNAPPNSEVALVAAANTNGFVKGGALCPGTQFEIGEPLQLPPTFVTVDGEGKGGTTLELGVGRCFVQALALAECATSNTVEVPGVATVDR
jgi:hypothetical protein